LRVRSDRAHTWDHDRIVVSFRCDKGTWIEFDEFLTEKFGNYKKSIIIEHLIKKYMKQKKDVNVSNLL
jgi:hypothetical protein